MDVEVRRRIERVEDSFLELGRESGSEEIRIPGVIVFRDRRLKGTGGQYNIVARIDVDARALRGTLRTITELFRPHGIPVSIGVPPTARPAGLVDLLPRHGFTFSGDVSVMALADAFRPGSVSGEVTVHEIDRTGLWRPFLDTFCDLVFEVFGAIPEQRPRRRERIFHHFQRARSRYYLAELDGRFVGTTIMHDLREVAYISAVGTLPGYRRRGVARALMARSIPLAMARNPRDVWLATDRDSVAESFYADLGFDRLFVLPLFRWSPPQ